MEKKLIGVRLSPEARERLGELAEAAHRSLSNMIEVLILQAKPEEVEVVREEDR